MSKGPEEVSTSPRPRGGEEVVAEPTEGDCQYICAYLEAGHWWWWGSGVCKSGMGFE